MKIRIVCRGDSCIEWITLWLPCTIGNVFLFACFILSFIRCGIAFDKLRVYDNAILVVQYFGCKDKNVALFLCLQD